MQEWKRPTVMPSVPIIFVCISVMVIHFVNAVSGLVGLAAWLSALP